ncbi:hypothetical protein K0M31_010122 [Melipona bicolor]|uniref:Uncharacterized protein n=1 Tax=Melipona bicolor TaxID=60889 RepID=A0AA40KIU0_9HYME|nr:hypothetical protein K0M31_010122 [Melipona bicolor]
MHEQWPPGGCTKALKHLGLKRAARTAAPFPQHLGLFLRRVKRAIGERKASEKATNEFLLVFLLAISNAEHPRAADAVTAVIRVKLFLTEERGQEEASRRGTNKAKRNATPSERTERGREDEEEGCARFFPATGGRKHADEAR